MGRGTKIEWADDTINPMMGCDGCELYNPKREADDPTYEPVCYAKHLVDRYAGLKGWPAAFNKPTIFPERIEKACKWKDLTGTKRPTKPWLDSRPRMIFLDDLGDTFTESLPIDWLMPYVPAMEASPHIWMMLTKRPRRMAEFFGMLGRVPSNIWPGTSITGPASIGRIDDLLTIDGSTHHWVSIEPLWGNIDLTPYLYNRYHMGGARQTFNELALVIVGGESGDNPHDTNVNDIRSVIHQCHAAKKPCFVKQVGARPIVTDLTGWSCYAGLLPDCSGYQLRLKDSKGGDWSEWPDDLRVRLFPGDGYV